MALKSPVLRPRLKRRNRPPDPKEGERGLSRRLETLLHVLRSDSQPSDRSDAGPTAILIQAFLRIMDEPGLSLAF